MLSIDLQNDLENFETASDWLSGLGLNDCQAGHRHLLSIAQSGLSIDLLESLTRQLAEELPQQGNPDQALRNLHRFFAASRSPMSLAALIERERSTLPILLALFSASEELADLLVKDPDGFDLLRLTDGNPVHLEILQGELQAEIHDRMSWRATVDALRRFKNREKLRIAYGDLVRGIDVETTSRQLSILAEALVSIATQYCLANLQKKWGSPVSPSGFTSRFAFLATGDLGSGDPGFVDRLSLVAIYEANGQTTAAKKSHTNAEFFERLVDDVNMLLSEETELGFVFRLNLHKPTSSLNRSQLAENFMTHLHQRGRISDRIQWIRCRSIAGDSTFGSEIENQIKSWATSGLNQVNDLLEFKAIRKRICLKIEAAEHLKNLRTCAGGLNDLHNTVQFLQLVAGNGIPTGFQGTWIDRIHQLREAGILTDQEEVVLARNYRSLRTLSNRMQLVTSGGSLALPRSDQQWTTLRKMVDDSQWNVDGDTLQEKLQVIFEENRRVISHLMATESADDGEVAELVFDETHSDEDTEEILARYNFRDPGIAASNLRSLAIERHRFLSSRRCQHFLTMILAPLLESISNSSDPDRTLSELAAVSDSLGGKGSLWELFQTQPECLDLFVRMCSCAPYLVSLLVQHPGMIDELLESLTTVGTRGRSELQKEMRDVCEHADDLQPLLHGFQSSQHLKIGIRELTGNANLIDTQTALANVGDVCLDVSLEWHFRRLAKRLGTPQFDQRDCPFTIWNFGRYGGREPNYHSLIGFLLIYEGEGETSGHRLTQVTTNRQFFNELSRNIARELTTQTASGRLFRVDAAPSCLQPQGLAAISLPNLRTQLELGDLPIDLLLQLSQLRPCSGAASLDEEILKSISLAKSNHVDTPEIRFEIRNLRLSLEKTADPFNLKSGVGGFLDLDFVIRFLAAGEIGNVEDNDETPRSVLQLLSSKRLNDELTSEQIRFATESYTFLRKIESSLRLMDFSQRHSLPVDADYDHPISGRWENKTQKEQPDDPTDLETSDNLPGRVDHERSMQQKQLCQLVGYHQFEALIDDCLTYQKGNRELFDRFFPPRAD